MFSTKFDGFHRAYTVYPAKNTAIAAPGIVKFLAMRLWARQAAAITPPRSLSEFSETYLMFTCRKNTFIKKKPEPNKILKIL
jgi:hypothetical protein